MKINRWQKGIAHKSLIFLIVALAIALSILAYFNQVRKNNGSSEPEPMNYFEEP